MDVGVEYQASVSKMYQGRIEDGHDELARYSCVHVPGAGQERRHSCGICHVLSSARDDDDQLNHRRLAALPRTSLPCYLARVGSPILSMRLLRP